MAFSEKSKNLDQSLIDQIGLFTDRPDENECFLLGVEMKSSEIEQAGTVIYLEKRKTLPQNQHPLFWGIASGKGGVGRSFFTSSLGIALSRAGYKVLMVDYDQNGGSLHSWLGLYRRAQNISDYHRNIDEIENYIVKLPLERLSIMPGDTCLWNSEEDYVRDIDDLFTDLEKQKFDIILFDLSNGFNQKNAQILKKMNEIFLLSTPEATSIEKTYRWIENYILQIGLDDSSSKTLLDFSKTLRESSKTSKGLFEVRDFLEGLSKNKAGKSTLFGPLKLVINQIRNFEDEKIGESMKSICNKFYFTDIQPLGFLQYDNAVWQCARQKVPVLIHQPFNPLVGQIQGLVKQIVDQAYQSAVG